VKHCLGLAKGEKMISGGFFKKKLRSEHLFHESRTRNMQRNTLQKCAGIQAALKI
jgi:hypothetical protein